MPFVIYDLFPANVVVTPKSPETGAVLTEHSFEISAARVVVTEDQVLIVIDSPSGPVLVMDLPYEAGNFHQGKTRYDDSLVSTSTGQRLAFKKDDSCGCGSRLRSWNPYNSIVARG